MTGDLTLYSRDAERAVIGRLPILGILVPIGMASWERTLVRAITAEEPRSYGDCGDLSQPNREVGLL